MMILAVGWVGLPWNVLLRRYLHRVGFVSVGVQWVWWSLKFNIHRDEWDKCHTVAQYKRPDNK